MVRRWGIGLAIAVIAVVVAGVAVPREQDPGRIGGGGPATGSRTAAMEVGDPNPGGGPEATAVKPGFIVDQDPSDNLPTP